MNQHPIHRLDDDVHQRVRLGILAVLSSVARADLIAGIERHDRSAAARPLGRRDPAPEA